MTEHNLCNKNYQSQPTFFAVLLFLYIDNKFADHLEIGNKVTVAIIGINLSNSSLFVFILLTLCVMKHFVINGFTIGHLHVVEFKND